MCSLQGVSRSVVFVVGYLMWRHRIRLARAMRMVTRVRSIVRPNERFLLSLAELELRCFGESTVAGQDDPLWNFYAWQQRKSHVTASARTPRRGCAVQ